MIDRKLEPLVKRQMTKYLGELEDDDLIMFVLEHLKDHKGPQKLIEGLEPVRVQLPPVLHLTSRLHVHTNVAHICGAYRYSKKRRPSSSSASGARSSSRA